MSTTPIYRNPASLYTLETELARISELCYELQRLYEKKPDDVDALQQEEDDLSRTEMEQEMAILQAQYEQAMLASTQKRDAMAYAIKQQDREAEFAAEEAQRLAQRARGFKSAAKRLKDLTLGIIFSLPKQGGKYQMLKGNHATLRSWKNAQPTVVVSNEAVVAPEYRMAEIHMPLDLWKELLASAPEALLDRLDFEKGRGFGWDSEIRPSWILEQIKAGGVVEGAHTEDGYHLRIV